ncbi:MAG: hypothetical protein NTY65_12080 [Planctomycetota bacterium]|nr:hypothetical protein [Planctomycetota bacterium]
MATETQPVFVRRMAAAARAAWWTWLIGVAIALAQSAVYVVVSRHECLMDQIACIMAVQTETARAYILAFMLIIRSILAVGLLAAIFLSLWARALRRAEEA